MTLSERADACMAALDAADRAIARRVCLRLIRFGDVGPAAGNQPLGALRAADDDGARFTAVLGQLADAGLVAIDGDAKADAARVALDAAALAWPALRTWLATYGAPEQLRRQLEEHAAAWSQRGDKSRLYDKRQLGELASLTPEVRRDLGVTAEAESLLTASREAARRRWFPGPTTTGPVLAVAFTILILFTPIILLFIVVLSAWMIHRFQ
ncbi:MAG TPA: hypothetical protein VLM79_28670 [Kofleriaceae bacterium]|nr:hypothetical protein [Kofleriaceae bacterium]